MKAFTVNEIRQLFPQAIERTYEPGQIVIYDGDQPNHVVYVKSGAYKFYDIDSDGNEKILSIDGAGGIFPIFYTFEDKDHVDAFYSTLTTSTFLMIPMKAFRQVLNESSEASSRVLKWYAGQMDHMVMRLKSMEKSTARQKILEAFVYLSNQESIMRQIDDDWSRVTFPLSQQSIADLAGLTRETVNVTMKEIETTGVMRSPRKLVLEINAKKLQEELEIS